MVDSVWDSNSNFCLYFASLIIYYFYLLFFYCIRMLSNPDVNIVASQLATRVATSYHIS